MPRSFLVKKLKAEAFPAAGAPAPPYTPLEPPYALPGPAAGDGECGTGGSGDGPGETPSLLCEHPGGHRRSPGGVGGDAGQDGVGAPHVVSRSREGDAAGWRGGRGCHPSSPCPPRSGATG